MNDENKNDDVEKKRNVRKNSLIRFSVQAVRPIAGAEV